MKLSVIIPTHNRAEILKTTLQRVMAQTDIDFEVIVVDDGSTDETEQIVRNFQFPISNDQLNSKFQIPRPNDAVGQANSKNTIQPIIQYLKQPASHQGVARNRGVEVATGEIILFIGDDIFVEPGFLKAHLDFHTQHPEEGVVCLGYTTWDPILPINDYMRFLESSGWQFGYSLLKPGVVDHAEPYKFFYTSNISLKRSFFNKEKFDENFKVYGWEDIELGYRLWKSHGMKLYYEPLAKAFHHHLLTEEDLPKKMRAVGQSGAHFEKLHPEVSVVPRGIKAGLIRVLGAPFMLKIAKILSITLYYRLWSLAEFLRWAKMGIIAF